MVDWFKELLENPALWGFLGTLVGGLLSIKATRLSIAFESTTRLEERKQASLASYHKLQMEELLELQALIVKWGRAFTQYWLSVINSCGDDSTGGLGLGDSEFDEELRRLNAEIALRNSRITNKTLREDVKACVIAPSEPETRDDISGFLQFRYMVLDAVVDSIGREYRKHLCSTIDGAASWE